MRKIGLILLAALLLPLCACSPAEPAEKAPSPTLGANDIVVSPAGDDKAAGTEAAPLATLAAAKELAKTRDGDEPLTVWLRAGTYRLSEPLKFDASDRDNVTYRAYGDGEAVISGAQPVTGWQETTVNGVAGWVADVDGEAAFDILSDAAGATLSRTRYPEEGYFYVDGYDIEDLNNPLYGVIGQACGAFVAAKGDLLDFRNPENVDAFFPHNWTADSSPLESIDLETGVVKLSCRTAYCVEKDERYYYENVYEAMDKPGEWYLDRVEDRLYYIPRAGESLDGFVLYGAQSLRLMELYKISGIAFRELTFRDSECGDVLGAYGQSCFGNQGAFDIVSTDHISFTDCDFRNIGATAIRFGSDNQDCAVTDCTFLDIGFNALSICGTNVPLDDETVSRNFTVTNNHIERFGRICASGVGIGIQFVDTAEVANNEIHDGYYTGITAGYVWSHDAHTTRNIHIADNLIYDIGQGVLSDMGGIYTLGEQPGTVIEGNVIHDVSSYGGAGGYGGNGIYLDAGSSYITIRKNLIYNCTGEAMTITGTCIDVSVTNNILALSGYQFGYGFASVTESDTALSFKNNILLTDGKAIFADFTGTVKFVEGGNAFFDCAEGAGTPETFGHDTDAVFADPLFADPKNGDFTLAENSPVLAEGFEAWNYSAAGLLKK